MEVMAPQTLLSELDRARARLAKQPVVDQKKEFLENVYPLMRLAVENIVYQGVRLDQSEAALAELLTGDDSIITPELANRLVGTLQVGLELARYATSQTKPTKAKKDKLIELANAFHEAATLSISLIQDFTVTDEVEEAEEEAEEEEETGNDELNQDHPRDASVQEKEPE